METQSVKCHEKEQQKRTIKLWLFRNLSEETDTTQPAICPVYCYTSGILYFTDPNNLFINKGKITNNIQPGTIWQPFTDTQKQPSHPPHTNFQSTGQNLWIELWKLVARYSGAQPSKHGPTQATSTTWPGVQQAHAAEQWPLHSCLQQGVCMELTSIA